MPVKEVTAATFKSEVLDSPIPVVVDFNAEWCGPCRRMKPILDAVAEQTAGVKFVSVDIDSAQSLAIDFAISSIPCLILFKGGAEVNRSVGLIGPDELASFVSSAL